MPEDPDGAEDASFRIEPEGGEGSGRPGDDDPGFGSSGFGDEEPSTPSVRIPVRSRAIQPVEEDEQVQPYDAEEARSTVSSVSAADLRKPTAKKSSVTVDEGLSLSLMVLGIIVFFFGIYSPAFVLIPSLWRVLVEVIVAGSGGALAMLGFTLWERTRAARPRPEPKPEAEKGAAEGRRATGSAQDEETPRQELERNQRKFGASFEIYDPGGGSSKKKGKKGSQSLPEPEEPS